MLLSELLAPLHVEAGFQDVEITDVVYDCAVSQPLKT